MKSLFQSGQFFLASQHAELIAFETAGTAMLYRNSYVVIWSEQNCSHGLNFLGK